MVFSPRLMLPMLLTILVLTSHMMLSDAVVTVKTISATAVSGDAFGNKPDPYVKVWCNGIYGGRTSTIMNNTNPTWTQKFHFLNCSARQNLRLELWDKDLLLDDLLGSCRYIVSSGSHTGKCTLPKGTLTFDYFAD